MIVVTVARKPLAESTVASNVLVHGTGALNIDESRISGIPAYPERRSAHVALPGDTRGKGSQGMFAQPASDNLPGPHQGGRWPANLVLEHKPGCRQVGVREEAGYIINRFTDGMKPFGNGAGHAYQGEARPATRVGVWECVVGCPVTNFDQQGGHSITGTRSDKSREARVAGTAWGVDNHLSREYPNEVGGASRFFKQVGGQP